MTHFLSRYPLEAENPYLFVDILRFHHKASHLFSARYSKDGRAERCLAGDRRGLAPEFGLMLSKRLYDENVLGVEPFSSSHFTCGTH